VVTKVNFEARGSELLAPALSRIVSAVQVASCSRASMELCFQVMPTRNSSNVSRSKKRTPAGCVMRSIGLTVTPTVASARSGLFITVRT
jgi:hypothetical protein